MLEDKTNIGFPSRHCEKLEGVNLNEVWNTELRLTTSNFEQGVKEWPLLHFLKCEVIRFEWSIYSHQWSNFTQNEVNILYIYFFKIRHSCILLICQVGINGKLFHAHCPPCEWAQWYLFMVSYFSGKNCKHDCMVNRPPIWPVFCLWIIHIYKPNATGKKNSDLNFIQASVES